MLTNQLKIDVFFSYKTKIAPIPGISRFFSLVLFLIVLISPMSTIAQTDEYTLKAIFFERFTRFVESDTKSTHPDFNIIVIGSNESMVHHLKKTYSKHTIQNKKVKVTQLNHVEDLKKQPCDILFISSNMSKDLNEITQYAYSQSILTIADSRYFANRGIVITFFIQSNTLNFKINTDAAKKSNLQISYHLLKIADIVTESKP